MKKIILVLAIALLSVQTARAEWGSVTTLDDGLYDSARPKVSFNSSGQGALVWNEESDVSGESSLYVSLYESGSWASPQSIATVNNSEHEIVVNEDGSVFVAWVNYNNTDSTYSLRVKIYDGSAWLATYIVNDGSDEYKFKILSGTLSESFLIWQKYASVLNLITYDASDWSDPEDIIPDYTKVYLQDASINSFGKMVVTASLDSTSSGHVSPHAVIFDGSSWSTPYLLTSKTPENYDYSVKNEINDDGNIWVSWEQENSSKRNLYFSFYSSDDGIWDEASYLNTYPVYYSDLDFNDSGDGVVSWSEYQSSSDMPIYYMTYKSGIWSDPDYLSKSCILNTNLHISMNDSGEILAVWVCDSLYVASRFYDGTQWLDEEGLGTCIDEYECDLQVSFNNDGEAAVTWVGVDDDYTQRIYTAIYTSSNGGSSGGSTSSGTGSGGGGTGTSSGSSGGGGSGTGTGATSGSSAGGGTDGGNLTESQAEASGCSFLMVQF